MTLAADEKDSGIKANSTSSDLSKILIYGMNYSPEIAGVGKYTGEIGEHFASKGSQVTVVTTPPHYPGWQVQSKKGNKYSSETANGVRIVRAPLFLRKNMKGIWRLLAPLSFAMTSAPVVVWQVFSKRPSVILCVEPTLFASPIALLMARLVGARSVLHVQDLEVDAAFAVGHLVRLAWMSKLAHALESLIIRRFDEIITISHRMADKISEKGVAPERIAVVRNWVDTKSIYPLPKLPNGYRTSVGFDEFDYIVLYSGNIGAKQGLNILLDAASLLAKNHRIKFVIAGEGPAKEGLIEKYGGLSNVKFLKFQPLEKLNEFLALADLHALPQDPGAADLVLPSKIGGMLASGRALLVAASRKTELYDFLEGAAHFVEPGSAVEFANAIEGLFDSHITEGQIAKRLGLAKVLSKDTNIELFTKQVFAGRDGK